MTVAGIYLLVVDVHEQAMELHWPMLQMSLYCEPTLEAERMKHKRDPMAYGL